MSDCIVHRQVVCVAVNAVGQWTSDVSRGHLTVAETLANDEDEGWTCLAHAIRSGRRVGTACCRVADDALREPN